MSTQAMSASGNATSVVAEWQPNNQTQVHVPQKTEEKTKSVVVEFQQSVTLKLSQQEEQQLLASVAVLTKTVKHYSTK